MVKTPVNRVHEKIKVYYRAEYKYLGEAISDFLDQASLAQTSFAKIVGVSPNTFKKVLKGGIKIGRTVSGPFSGNSVRKRLLSYFDIYPNEKKETIEKLPF